MFKNIMEHPPVTTQTNCQLFQADTEDNESLNEEQLTDLERNYFRAINKLGVLADIQYCDEDDGLNFDGTQLRRYRESLNVTRRAGVSFEKFEVGAILQLGDALDMKSKEYYERAFNDMLSPILQIPPPNNLEISKKILPTSIPRLDVMGNHELYCAPREKWRYILREYDIEKDLLCYSKEIAGGQWRMIVLDSYAISVLGYTQEQILDPNNEKFKYAQNIVKENNPSALDGPQRREDVSKDKQRFATFNGGVGQAQLEWLEQQLDEAWVKKQLVVIFSHIPISGYEQYSNSLHWDVEDILQLIEHKGAHVVACVGGHRHTFSHRIRNEFGTFTHHLDIPSPLLAPVGGECHAVLEFHVKNLRTVSTIKSGKESCTQDCNNNEETKQYVPLLECPETNMDYNLLDTENAAYRDGEILIKNDASVNDNVEQVGVIKVLGFGQIPKTMYLAKSIPKEWVVQ